MKTPITSQPCSVNRAAAVELSTPPLIARTTRLVILPPHCPGLDKSSGRHRQTVSSGRCATGHNAAAAGVKKNAPPLQPLSVPAKYHPPVAGERHLRAW